MDPQVAQAMLEPILHYKRDQSRRSLSSYEGISVKMDMGQIRKHEQRLGKGGSPIAQVYASQGSKDKRLSSQQA